MKNMPNSNQEVFILIPSGELLTNHLGELFTESELAYGFNLSDRDEMIWIPKSRIKDFRHNAATLAVEFWAESWLASAKNIEKFINTDYMPKLF